MSARNFARVFRADTGMTPAAHVEDLRIEAARQLLEQTDLTVAATAIRVGLKHPETLHRAADSKMPSSEADAFEEAVVAQWSEIHKRSTLVHLILVGLAQSPKWSAEVVAFVEEMTDGEWGVDERSLYRALRRLERSELVEHATTDAPRTGAKRKTYRLTDSGRRVLRRYEETTLGYLARLALLDRR